MKKKRQPVGSSASARPKALSNSSPSKKGEAAAAHLATAGKSPAIWISLSLILAIVVVYAPVAQFGFVRFDDPQYVVENPYVFSGLTAQGIRWAFTTGHAANWHPITWLSHMLDVELFGLNAARHHMTNVLLHAASAALLFLLLYQMTGAGGQSAFVAALFAIHPIHVESVAWVAERKDVLSTFWWVVTLWAYLGYVRRPQSSRYLLVVLSFSLALMAKPMVVTLPFVLLLLDFWPLHRITFAAGQQSVALRLIREKLPLFALSLISSVITFMVQQQGGTVAAAARLSFGSRLANAIVSYVAYITKMVWPSHLAAYYPYVLSLPAWKVIGCVLVLAAITAASLWKAKDYPYLPVGWLWYLGTLVPAIGLVQVGTQAMADRYTYVPMIGLSIMLAWGVPDLLRPWRQTRVAPVTAGLVVLACAIAARAQVKTWQSSSVLWEHALTVTADNYAAHTYMGNALAGQGKIADAIAHYTEALRIRPDYPEAHNNLGPALASQGKLDEAIAHFSEALRITPNYADAHNNLGVALASKRRFDEAIAHFSEAVRLEPNHPNAHYGFALALRNLGRIDEAIREFQEALRVNPRLESARRELDALTRR